MSLSPNDITAATKVINDHQRILVTPHANVDPDGLSSALACYRLFTAMGKDVTVICPDTPPEALSFLPGFEKLTQDVQGNSNFVITVNLEEGVEVDKLRYTVEDNKINIIVVPKGGRVRPDQISFGQGDKAYDLIVVVDSADLPLLGSLYLDRVDLFSETPLLNVDHHISNTRFGQLQLIDSTAASATEVLYSWFTSIEQWRKEITPDMATLLLTGLITDTRSFQNPNTTPRSLEVAAELLTLGARQQEIIEHIYKTKPLSTLKIWGRALNHIQVDEEARIVWSAISREDLAEMGATSKETSGLLDELISTIPDADVHVLFTELEEGGLKASMRSSAAMDVNRIAAEQFSGGGHARAAGFRIKQFSNFELAVIDSIRKVIDAMQRQRAEADEPRPVLEEVSPPAAKKAPKQAKPKKAAASQEARPSEKSVDVVQGLGDEEDANGGTDVVHEITETPPK